MGILGTLRFHFCRSAGAKHYLNGHGGKREIWSTKPPALGFNATNKIPNTTTVAVPRKEWLRVQGCKIFRRLRRVSGARSPTEAYNFRFAQWARQRGRRIFASLTVARRENEIAFQSGINRPPGHPASLALGLRRLPGKRRFRVLDYRTKIAVLVEYGIDASGHRVFLEFPGHAGDNKDGHLWH
jgi:hypothetical protein